MKYNILINQFAAVKNFPSLDLVDMAIFNYIFEYRDQCEKIIDNSGVWFWVSNQKIIDDLPILKITTKRNINNRINNLIECNLLVKHKDCKAMRRTYFSLGANHMLLINSSMTQISGTVQKTTEEGNLNPSSMDANFLETRTQISKDYTINDYTINDYNKEEEKVSSSNDKNNEEIKTKNKEEKEKKLRQKKEGGFIELIQYEFNSAFRDRFKFDYVCTNKGKDRAAIGKLISIYKKKYPESDAESTRKGLSSFFNQCMTVKNDFLINNMSPSIIQSQLNQFTILLNGNNKQQNRTNATREGIVAAAKAAFEE